MSSDDEKIAELQRKIGRENALISGAMQMRQSTDNALVQSQVDNQIRENRRNIEYFEGLLRDLQARRMGDLSLSGGSNGGPRPPSHGSGPTGYRNGPAPSPYGNQGPYGTNSSGYGDPGAGGYQDQLAGGNMNMPARAPYPPGGPAGSGIGSLKARPNYTRLDLIKYDTPHLGPRIQLMLSQLEFKLSVEKQYKDGVEKIMGSYNIDGDKKIRREAENRRIESMQKIQLLQRALKKYEALHVDADTSMDVTDDDSLNAPSMRKPLTGRLSLRVDAVSDVSHASRGKTSRGPETWVIMKVEDDFKGRTKVTKTDRWTDELHDILIDKGNEIELTVYDKSGGDHPTPVGMVWIRISDIAEEMRRKKIETEFNNSGWVSADRTMEDGQGVRPDLHFNPPPGSSGGPSGMIGGGGFNSGVAGMAESQPVVIDAWFSLEPVGRIHLAMSFEKQTRERRPLDGLNRKGAIRQRKEDVHELYGHKFISQQFYNIMRCALCGELLKYATGMQCADCKYMCHEKCYGLVVTKCITKSNAESDPDEAKLNHRIPHRFEAFANMGANWCCHCGYMLPLGRKNCRRCKECKLTSHTQCAHLIPDFCGMSMKDANRILGEIKNVVNKPKTLRPLGKEPKSRPSPNTQMSYMPERQDTQQPALTDRYSYGQEPMSSSHVEPQFQPDPQGQGRPPQSPPMKQSMSPPPSQASLSAAAGAFSTLPPQQPQQQQPQSQQQQQRRPVPPRSDSSQSAIAAAAAANALANKRGSSTDSRPPIYTRTSGGSGSYNTPQAERPQQQSNIPPPHSQYNPQDYANIDQRFQAPPQPPQQQQQQQQQVSPPQQQGPYGAAPTSQGAPQLPPIGQPAPASTFVERKNDPPPSQERGSRRRIGLDHFNFLAVLGKGNFGKVMLAETKATKQLYAIKVLKKEFIIENDEVESTKSERDVFIIANKARHPFLTNLHACFQTETRVYFVMEYISGGDLMWHIQRGQFGTKRAQYYAAEVCLALKYFHENGVVYRDLKLDNIMLTLDGHIKIADYGLCKKDMYYGSTTSTFCGTPEFMAPEILLDKKYGRAVDWWAFGVLIYQMLLQQSPFRGEDEDEIYDAILADEPLYPIHMPRDSVSILQKLLTREPELRLGSGPTDAQEIMAHPFFRNVDWQDILDKKIAPPFMPQIKSATDTSNFDSEFTSVTPVLTPVQSVLSQAMQEEFRGFSYSADFV